MTLVSDSATLARLCEKLAFEPYITVDTEFIREKTYYPELCLVQLAGPDEAWAIDTLAPGIDLTPLFALMADEKVIKVFHAARQDVEIFLNRAGFIPKPLFDTQIAAMVCGFGDSVGYEALAAQLARARIDKTMRFTDWARRPLSDKQIHYALSDVTHLRTVYEKLHAKLAKNGRESWLDEEIATLLDPATYLPDPETVWRRLKPRSNNPRFLAVLRELAAWREREARSRDLPRQRVVRDEALLEIAAHAPSNLEELSQARGINRSVAEGNFGTAMLAAVARAKALPESECPKPLPKDEAPRSLGPMVDLLKVLLKMKCDEHEVAQKLVASSPDLDAIAADDNADVPAMHGWRRELFGEAALQLKHGRLALAFSPDGRRLRLIPVEPE
jgi:ribonuclease D